MVFTCSQCERDRNSSPRLPKGKGLMEASTRSGTFKGEAPPCFHLHGVGGDLTWTEGAKEKNKCIEVVIIGSYYHEFKRLKRNLKP